MTNECPFQVLVGTGNQAILAVNLTPASLLPGQFGFFDYDTGLSFTATQAATYPGRRFFVAVGVDRDGDTVTDDIIKSAGEVIVPGTVNSIYAQCYAASAPKIVDITAFTAKCDTDYCVKVEVENATSRLVAGFQNPYKTFVVHTSCCTDDCETCPEGDCNELAQLLVDNINEDPDGLLIAEYLDYTTDPDAFAVVDAEDVAAWIADTDNTGLCLGVRITTVNLALYSFCGINLQYERPRETNVTVTLGCGFECNGTVTTFQDITFEEGGAYDIKQLEYQAGGWNGKPGPYKTSSLVGMPINFSETFTTAGAHYSQIWIQSKKTSNSAWLNYEHEVATLLVFPCASSTTATAIINLLVAVMEEEPNWDGKTTLAVSLTGCCA